MNWWVIKVRINNMRGRIASRAPVAYWAIRVERTGGTNEKNQKWKSTAADFGRCFPTEDRAAFAGHSSLNFLLLVSGGPWGGRTSLHPTKGGGRHGTSPGRWHLGWPKHTDDWCETRMADHRPREVSGSGLAYVRGSTNPTAPRRSFT